MNGFLYGVALQWKLDIRSKSLLVTCYIVPLIFFLLMGGIFTSVMPEMRSTLIQSMIVMSVSMGAFIGLPPSLIETYGSDVKKVYKANGVPLYLGLVTMFLSAFVHLMISCAIILLLAPILFEAALPVQLPFFFLALAIYIIVSLSIGSILGLVVKNQAKLTMIAQLVFLPSIMLSGIMFPIDLLPDFLEAIGRIFPASWGYRLMLDNGFCLENLSYLILVFCTAVIICAILLNKQKSKWVGENDLKRTGWMYCPILRFLSLHNQPVSGNLPRHRSRRALLCACPALFEFVSHIAEPAPGTA